MKKRRKNKAAEAAARIAAALAAATKGRARTFINRKKQASRDACRGKDDE